ncbi:MAG: 2Fe-2S iron-sulfur cluster-binding protein [Cyanobacteria bacterium P01_E01_bin.34]
MSRSPYSVHFPNSDFTPIALESHQHLAEVLTVQNSPVLFGCRTGICGTCLVLVEGDIPLPDRDEQEMLDIFAAKLPQARLACQIAVTDDIALVTAKQG